MEVNIVLAGKRERERDKALKRSREIGKRDEGTKRLNSIIIEREREREKCYP
jgi:hypothetical protein